MLNVTRQQIRAAAEDIAAGAKDWQLWHLLAWYEIKQRYRRSTLGPFWLTISMAVQILVMGWLLTFLFQSRFGTFLPYICASLVIWSLLSQIVMDGATAFLSASAYILQMRKPLTIYILQVIWRNIIIAGHNAIVYLIVAFVFLIAPDASVVLLPVALALAILSVGWLALLLAVVSTRYRDVPMMVQSLFGVLFWMTPIVYRAEQLGDRRYLADLNPLTHVVDILRGPLIGTAPSLTSWLAVIGMTAVGWTVAFLFFARFRSRVPYWL